MADPIKGRFWDWRDDDYTGNMNKWFLGILEPGRYRGFDYSSLTAGMDLVLEHRSGIEKVNIDQTYETIAGILLTKQGVVIVEHTNVELTVNPNPSADPRIDLIVCNHEYQQVTGGIAQTYSIIEGTPSPTPSRPALPNETVQTIVGQLLLPAGTVALTEALYTAETIPDLANDGTIGHTDRFQFWSVFQQFSGLYLQVAYAEIKDNKLVLGTAPYTDRQDANIFFINDITPFADPSWNPLESIISWDEYNLVAPTTDKPRVIWVYTPYNVMIPSDTGIITPSLYNCYVYAGTMMQFTYDNVFGQWRVVTGGQVELGRPNKLRAQLAQARIPDSSYILDYTTGTLELTGGGNIVRIPAGTNPNDGIAYIKAPNVSLDAVEEGTVIRLYLDPDTINPSTLNEGNPLIIAAASGAPVPPPGFKAIVHPGHDHFYMMPGSCITLLETDAFWVVIAKEGTRPFWRQCTPNVAQDVNTNTDVWVSIENNRLAFRGEIFRRSAAATLPVGNQLNLITLPTVTDIGGNDLYSINALVDAASFNDGRYSTIMYESAVALDTVGTLSPTQITAAYPVIVGFNTNSGLGKTLQLQYFPTNLVPLTYYTIEMTSLTFDRGRYQPF